MQGGGQGGALGGRDIAIAGGGIAGLAAAAALAGRGAEVRVLERAPRLREEGAGLQVSPNGLAVLRALGLEERAMAAGATAEAVELRDGLNDALVLRLALDRPYLFLPRRSLVALLAGAARAAGAEIRPDTPVTGPDPSGPRARFREGGRPAEADLLLGADGIRSALRAVIAEPGAAPARFTGQVAWRAVIAAEPGAPPVATVAMGPGRHLVSYPMGGGRRNIVAVEERAAWAEESWTRADDPDALRRAFAGFAPRIAGWLDRVEEVHLWGLFRHPVAGRWHRGPTAILGDAAHPTLPFLAQGASMALEDAWRLAAHLGRTDQDGALAAWAAERGPRVRRIVAAAEANAKRYHLRPPLRCAAHLALRLAGRLAPGAPMRRFDWLYGYDPTQG